MDLTTTVREIVGAENVITERTECICYSRDMSVHEGVPDMIVYAETADQISKIMKTANEAKVPVTARGTGSSVTGAVLPIEGGILLDLSKMNKVVEINPANFYVRVQPGVICAQLNNALASHKMFFPPDPGSAAIATLGGMVNTNASGLRAVKYGTTKDYVKGLEAVLVDGSIIRTGTLAPKSATGYDLSHMFVSSEGTLGIITEITFKIEPKPEYEAFAVAYFENLDDAGKAMTEILQAGIPLCAGEIMDKVSMDVCRDAMKMDIPPVEAMTIMEVDGHKSAVQDQMKQIKRICEKNNGMNVRWSDDPAERADMWKGRAGLVSALSRWKPGYRLAPVCEDFGVPISNIPDMIRGAQDVSKKHDVMIATFGHVGDGNVHTTFVVDLLDASQWDRLKAAANELVELAFQNSGTISAEHGTGLTRAALIGREMGTSFEVMKTVKHTMDPNNILNPGKMGFDGKINDMFFNFAFEPLLKGRAAQHSLGEFEDNELLKCVMCGFCRLGCPTFSVTNRESRNAKGRNILAYQLFTGQMEPSQELADTYYRCTTCGTCTYFCPAQIKVPEIVASARKKLAEAGFIPESYKAVVENIQKTGNPFASKKEDRIEVYPTALKKAVQEKSLPEKSDTLLFMGCVPSFVDMKIVPAFINNLDKANEPYTTFAMEEGCCGLPVYLSGSEAFTDLAKSNIERIKASGAKQMVTPCAGCYHSFKDIYSKVGELGVELHHAVEYLEQLIDEGKLTFTKSIEKKITYHDPCDLGRRLGIFEPPRNIIKKVPGVQFVEMGRNRLQGRCCGAGGGVAAVDPDFAVSMAVQRVQDAFDVGAEILVSACASCKDNLRKGLQQFPKDQRKSLKIIDINELVLQAVGK